MVIEKRATAEGTLEVDRKQEETPIVDSNFPQKCTEVDNIYLMVSILYAVTCRRTTLIIPWSSYIYRKTAPETKPGDWSVIAYFFPPWDQERDCSMWKPDLAPQTVQDVFSVQVPGTTKTKQIRSSTLTRKKIDNSNIWCEDSSENKGRLMFQRRWIHLSMYSLRLKEQNRNIVFPNLTMVIESSINICVFINVYHGNIVYQENIFHD